MDDGVCSGLPAKEHRALAHLSLNVSARGVSKLTTGGLHKVVGGKWRDLLATLDGLQEDGYITKDDAGSVIIVERCSHRRLAVLGVSNADQEESGISRVRVREGSDFPPPSLPSPSLRSGSGRSVVASSSHRLAAVEGTVGPSELSSTEGPERRLVRRPDPAPRDLSLREPTVAELRQRAEQVRRVEITRSKKRGQHRDIWRTKPRKLWNANDLAWYLHSQLADVGAQPDAGDFNGQAIRGRLASALHDAAVAPEHIAKAIDRFIAAYNTSDPRPAWRVFLSQLKPLLTEARKWASTDSTSGSVLSSSHDPDVWATAYETD